jgi:hypothetical protein
VDHRIQALLNPTLTCGSAFMDSSSFSLTLNAVRRQLSAMACVRFELGLRHRTSGRMLLRSLQINQIILALPWLRFMNAHHHDIFVRPLFPIGLILLDDLSRQAVHQLPSLGFAPSVVLITSPNNHQAWVRLIHNRHSQPLSKSLLTSAARHLAFLSNADISSADWRHFGRLAGFTNRKPEHFDGSHFPFVRLIFAAHRIALQGRPLLLHLRHSEKTPNHIHHTNTTPPIHSNPLQLYSRHRNAILKRCRNQPWIHNPDISRLDFMIACNILKESRNTSLVARALQLGSPNLQLRKQQHIDDYIQRTIRAAQATLTNPS